MDSAFARRPMYRIVEEAGPCLREAEDKGCALWLVLDPFCHALALARLYEYNQSGDIVELFRNTPLEQSRKASPRVAAIGSESPLLHWLSEADPRNWGMILVSDAPLEEILAHLRSLLLVRTDEDDAILQVWNGSVLSRICRTLPEEIPVLLGPVRRVVTRSHIRSWACIDRDGERFMEAPHSPSQPLPCPWYRITERHERAFHDQRPATLTHNIIEALLQGQPGPVLPPTERLQTFVARHVERGLGLGLWRAEALELFVRCCLLRGESFPEMQPVPFSRHPIDEDTAIAAMCRIVKQGGSRD